MQAGGCAREKPSVARRGATNRHLSAGRGRGRLSLERLPDVQAWCYDRGMTEDHPSRQAKCARGKSQSVDLVMRCSI
jgi:hypothetical protein